MPHLPEKKESLWMLTAAPVLWAAHFLLSYGTAAIWCAKVAGRDGSLTGARVAIAVYTIVALAGIGVIGWAGLRRHRKGHPTTPHAADTPEDRHRFLGFATLLLAILSGVATIYSTLAAVFIQTCR